MELRWKKKDSALFSGMPRDGKCAPAKRGDLTDLVCNALDLTFAQMKWQVATHNREVEEHNQAVDEAMETLKEFAEDPEGFEGDLDVRIPYVGSGISKTEAERSICSHLLGQIDRAFDENGKFYIGQVPPFQKDSVFSISGKDYSTVAFDAGKVSIPGIEEAKEDVKALHYYVAGPLFELMHIILRLVLYAAHVFLYLLGISLPLFNTKGTIFEKLPLLPAEVVNRLSTGQYFYDTLICLGVGAVLVVLNGLIIEHYSLDDDQEMTAYMTMAQCGFVIVLAACMLRFLLISHFAQTVMVYLGTLFIVVYGLSHLMFVVRFLKRFVPGAMIPLHYTPSFPKHAERAYRFCRLLMIWYEQANGKHAPAYYANGIRELDKLDKRFRKDIRRFAKITGFPIKKAK